MQIVISSNVTDSNWIGSYYIIVHSLGTLILGSMLAVLLTEFYNKVFLPLLWWVTVNMVGFLCIYYAMLVDEQQAHSSRLVHDDDDVFHD